MLKFFHKVFFNSKASRQGQHVSEYTLLIISVMMGVLVAGPYVIRSWNALLKAYESDVIESFTDPLRQAPPDSGECACGDPEPGECGVTFDGETCTPQERMWFRECQPIDCHLASGIDISECRLDPTCCPWVDLGCALNSCLPGEMAQVRSCTSDTRCVPDPLCQACTGIFTPGQPWREEICPNDLINVNPAPQPFVRVNETNCSVPSDTTKKCEIECQKPYEASADGSQCVCPDGLVDKCVPLPPDPTDTSGCCAPDQLCRFLSSSEDINNGDPRFECNELFPGTFLFVQYFEADFAPSERSFVKICCTFQSSCTAFPTQAGPTFPPGNPIPHPYHICTPEQGREIFKMCTGNCNQDDNKVVICCTDFPDFGVCWDVNGEEYQRRTCENETVVLAESCTGGGCSGRDSWMAMCCGPVAPKCTGILTPGTYDICSNINPDNISIRGERFSNEALQVDTPWNIRESQPKCALEDRTDDIDNKCEIRCKSGFRPMSNNCVPE